MPIPAKTPTETPRIGQRFKAYIGLVNTAYQDLHQIEKTIKAGLSFCGYEPCMQDILVKPSLLHSDITFGRHALTNPDFFAAAAEVLLATSPEAKLKISIEKNFLGLTKSTAFKLAGYADKMKNHPTRVRFITENDTKNHRVLLAKEYNLTKRSLTRSQEMIDSAQKIFLPKIRTDLLSDGFGGAVRLGSESSVHTNNAYEICDALEICNPDYVIGDGIIVPVGGSRITQIGQELGLILVSNNAIAHDLVATAILNLDPNRIPHLQIAAKRGWGPASVEDIEIGTPAGTGHEALLKILAQKTRSWNLGIFPVIRLKEKYEFENPGFKFPFEILAHLEARSQVATNITLDSICMAMDTPVLRPTIARWPKASLCIGEVTTYPARELIYVIGIRACSTINTLISTTQWRLSALNISFARVTLKNGCSHLLVKIGVKKEVSYWSLAFALAFVSKGKILFPFLTFKYVTYFVTGLLKNFKIRHSGRQEKGLLISSQLKQNSWWATKCDRHLFPPTVR